MHRRAGSLLPAVLIGTTLPTAAQWLNYPTRGVPRLPDGKPDLTAPVPRTADGKPDLSGIWVSTTGPVNNPILGAVSARHPMRRTENRLP
jgi:hypothetical protein